jgi:hypothetical protein
LGEWAVEWAGKGVEQWVVGDHLTGGNRVCDTMFMHTHHRWRWEVVQSGPGTAHTTGGDGEWSRYCTHTTGGGGEWSRYCTHTTYCTHGEWSRCYTHHRWRWEVVQVLHTHHRWRWEVVHVLYTQHRWGWGVVQVVHTHHRWRWGVVQVLHTPQVEVGSGPGSVYAPNGEVVKRSMNNLQ